MEYSIIIPVLNEEETLILNKKYIQNLKNKLGAEIIIVDGQSNDKTKQIAKSIADQVHESNPSRSLQFNKGVMHASGMHYIFLHVDTILDDDAINSILNIRENFRWGFFQIKLDQNEMKYSFLAYCINLRSKLFNYCTGDQVLIVSKSIFHKLNGYREIELMEDIDLTNKLKKISNPVILPGKAMTSSRRWKKYGYIKTILLMRFIRLLFFLGVSTKNLRKIYR
tara:strand:+ start:872 stop:1543 length:672 start_codon:yes stop_codon:yes gene_type:complete